MAAEEGTFIIKIHDPENGQLYSVFVNEEDYNRFQIDEQFASSLLFHAKCSANITNNQTESVDVEVDHERDTEIIEEDSINQIQSQDVSNKENTKQIVCWGYNETIDLINSMASHYEDFNHPKKRKHIYELICNDLISLSHNVTALSVQNKWKSLVRSYSKAKDNKSRTEQGPSRFHFFDKFDEILGNKPTNACSHSLSSIDNASETTTAGSLLSNIGNDNQTCSSPASTATSLHDTDNCSNSDNVDGHSNVKQGTNTTQKVRLTDMKLQREYIDMKKEEYDKKQRRHDERVGIENEKLEVEKKKIKLLEDYLLGRK